MTTKRTESLTKSEQECKESTPGPGLSTAIAMVGRDSLAGVPNMNNDNDRTGPISSEPHHCVIYRNAYEFDIPIMEFIHVLIYTIKEK